MPPIDYATAMARVAEERPLAVDAAWIEDALVTALTHVGSEPPHATGPIAWRGRAVFGPFRFAIHAALARSEGGGSVVSLVVEREASLGSWLASAVPRLLGAMVNRRPSAALAALEAGTGDDITNQDAAASMAQSFWEAFDARLAVLTRASAGAYRGQ
jgi:hypothetical protein